MKTSMRIPQCFRFVAALICASMLAAVDCRSAPLAITGVEVGSVSTKGAILRWDTDVAADGRVSYGTSTNYGVVVAEAESTKDHYVFLDNLAPGTTYHYRVLSGGETSADMSFTTAAKIEELWPVVSLSFDDGHISHFKTAFPLMKARNMRGAVNVITDRLAKSVGMSLAQVQFLQQQGWEVDSHSRAHNRVKGLTDEDEIVGSMTYLETNGIKKVMCYRVPGSNHSKAREELAAQHYPLRWGNVIGGPSGARYTTLPLVPGMYAGIGLDVINTASAEARMAKYKAAIDEMLARHLYTHLIFHAIADLDPPGYNYPPKEFEALLDYLQAKGIKVIPPGELLQDKTSSSRSATPASPMLEHWNLSGTSPMTTSTSSGAYSGQAD
jgi:peptidoglycan/xylan/chitin deacetylase (PgdA/CDA1 family)